MEEARLRPEAKRRSLGQGPRKDDASGYDWKPPPQAAHAIGADGLPYLLLRDAERLDVAAPLLPDEAWPTRVIPRATEEYGRPVEEGEVGPPIQGDIPLATMVVRN